MKPKTTKEWEREFEREMDKYIRHAGEWHNALCYFVYEDQGVCNCNLSKNRKAVKQFIQSLLDKQVEGLRMKEKDERPITADYDCLKDLGYNQATKEFNKKLDSILGKGGK